MFPEGSLVERRILAPTVYVQGRHRARVAWQGAFLLEGEVVEQYFNCNSRRHSYKVGRGG